MSIIRTVRARSFTAIPNHLAQDNTLSFEARGLLLYLLSKPDDWECRISDIEREGNMGKEKRRRIMIEAERAGYITFAQGRDSQGRFQSAYSVYESPVPESERTQSWLVPERESGATDDGISAAENTAGGKPAPGKPGDLIKTDLQKTDLQKKEIQKDVGRNDFSEPKSSAPASRLSASLLDKDSLEAWLSELQADEAYKGLAVRMLYAKMLRWCEVNGKKPSKRRFINWLNREDQALPAVPKFTPEKLEKAKADVARYVAGGAKTLAREVANYYGLELPAECRQETTRV